MNTQNTKHLAIIGHTNTGKTSLMRTLLRDDAFGEVKNASATTRHVESVTVYDTDNTPLLCLYDTPGLEDATGVMDFLQEHTNQRLDGVERLSQFLQAVQDNNPTLPADFSQEAKVIKTLLVVDVAIYVVDVREPVLSKYQDELAILASSGTPILPVFNFVNDTRANAPQWQSMLARRALHVVNSFDTVAFDFESEMALWHNLHTLTHATQFLTLKQNREAIWLTLAEEGSLIIADFLVNVASFSQKLSPNTDTQPQHAAMQHAVRQAFSIMQTQLLQLYKFYHITLDSLPLAVATQHQDIFDSQLLARYGIRTAGGSVAGMIVGAGLDVASFGASLGLGTAIGGMIGGILPNGRTLKDKALGIQTLLIDDTTLTLIATQAQHLHYQLRHRGHASLKTLEMTTNFPISPPWQTNKLPTPLKQARTRPEYCSLTTHYNDKRSLRDELTSKLAWTLNSHLHDINE